MADLAQTSPRALVMVAGMKETKDARGFFEPFKGLALHVETVAIPNDNACLSPSELAEAATAAGLDATPASSVELALDRAAARTGREAPRILICGSLYLAGAILAENG
jgi:dihydrofolate synthase/folylpolyglutamate synthase